MELGIRHKYEMSRTHWAVKEVNLFKELSNIGILKKNEAKITVRHPLATASKDVLELFGTNDIRIILEKALERVQDDPEGSITSARTVLETVCKQILEKRSIKYNDKEDLPGLYFKVSSTLDISPSEQTEDIFRRIFGGCTSIIEGLGSLRNKLGDAHGRGLNSARAATRHARLATNLATATVSFLLETFEAQEQQKANLKK